MLKALWNRINKDEQGFTMVELLIVIVILGVLAGIGIPTYRGFVDRANEAANLSELQAINMAIKYYKIENVQEDAFPELTDLNRYLGEELKIVRNQQGEVESVTFLDTYNLSEKLDENKIIGINASPIDGTDRHYATIDGEEISTNKDELPGGE